MLYAIAIGQKINLFTFYYYYYYYYYFVPGSGAKYCDQLVYVCLFLSVCLLVCLSACIFQKPNIQISPNFLHMLPVTLAWSSSDGNAISYAFLVLWMT